MAHVQVVAPLSKHSRQPCWAGLCRLPARPPIACSALMAHLGHCLERFCVEPALLCGGRDGRLHQEGIPAALVRLEVQQKDGKAAHSCVCGGPRQRRRAPPPRRWPAVGGGCVECPDHIWTYFRHSPLCS